MQNITFLNIGEVEPEELVNFLHENYDDLIICKEQNLDITDLAAITGCLGWCQNVESFLMPLMAKMDIESRKYVPTKEPGSDYQNAICKKAILNLYYDHIDRLYKTLSRQCSLYATQMANEYAIDRRIDQVGRTQVPEAGYVQFS